MEDNKRKLYDALSQDYDLGSFEQFSADIADDTKRRKLYDATAEEYDYGDYDTFSKQLGFGVESPSRPTTETEPVGQVEQPAQSPVNPQAASEGRAMFNQQLASRRSTIADAPQATRQYMAENPVQGGRREMSREELVERLATVGGVNQPIIDEYEARWADYQRDIDNELGGPEVDAKKKWLDEHNAEYRAAQQAIGEIEGQINLMDQPKNLEAIAAKKAENQKHIAPKAISTTGTGYFPTQGEGYDMQESANFEAANNILDQTAQTYKQGSKYDPGYKGNWLEQTWTAARQFVEGGANNFDMGSLTFGLTEGSSMAIARRAGDKSNKIVNDTLKKLGYTDKQVNGLLDSVNEKGKNLSEMSDVIREESAALESMKATIDGWNGSQTELQAYIAEYQRRAKEFNKSIQNYNTALADYEKDAKQYETIMSAVGAAVESGLSDGEKAVLDALQDFTTAKMRRAKDVSIASAAGAGAEQSAEFMLDFILTGGLEKASTKLVSKWLLKDATKELGFGGKVLADIISSAGRTAVMMPRNLAAYGENLVQMTGGVDNLGRYQFDRTHLNAALNTALNQYIEYWSEGFGEYFAAGERAAFKRITGSAPRTTIGKTLSQYRGNIGQYLDHGKFNGMFNEMLEEVVGAHLDALAGWMSGDRVGDKDAIKNFYSGEQMATLALSFLPMSAISAGTNIRAYNKMKERYDNAVATLNPFLNSDKITREELDELVSNIADKTPQEITAKIVEITDNARKKNGGYLPNNFAQSLMGYVEGTFAMSLNNETWENSQEKMGVVNAYTEQYANPDERNAYDLAQLESEARAAAESVGFDENMLELDPYSIARHAQALQQSNPSQAQVLLSYAAAKSAKMGLKDGYDAETTEYAKRMSDAIEQKCDINGNVIRATLADGSQVFITSKDASVGADGKLNTPTGADGLVSYIAPDGRELQAKASAFTGATAQDTTLFLIESEDSFKQSRDLIFERAQNTISPAGKARALNANIGNTVFFRMNGIYEPMQVDRITQDGTHVVVSGDAKFLNGLATMLGLQSPGGQSMELPIETIWPMLATNDDGSLATNQPEAEAAQPAEAPASPQAQSGAATLDGRPIGDIRLDEENGWAYFTYQDDPNRMMQVMDIDEFRQKTGQSETPAAPAEQPQAPAVEEAPAEEAPAEEVPQSKIPVDKNGNKIYDAPGVEPIDAYEDMYSTEGLSEEDVDEWVISQSDEAEKNRNPKIKKGQSLADWGKEKAEANRKADFWKELREVAEQHTQERKEQTQREAELQKEIEKYGVDTRNFDLTPQTVEEAVAEYLGNNEGIIDLDDAKKEIFGKSGRIPSELFRHAGNGGILTKKGGRKIADVANDIVGEFEGQLPIQQDAVRDLIIDYLSRYTKTEMRDMIFNNRLTAALAELEQQNGASEEVEAETAEEVEDIPAAEEQTPAEEAVEEAPEGTAVPEVEEPVADAEEPETPSAEEEDVPPAEPEVTETVVVPVQQIPDVLRAAYESGNAAQIEAAEKAMADFINSSDSVVLLRGTESSEARRRKEAKKDSAEYKLHDFILKAIKNRLSKIDKAEVKAFDEARKVYEDRFTAEKSELQKAIDYFEKEKSTAQSLLDNVTDEADELYVNNLKNRINSAQRYINALGVEMKRFEEEEENQPNASEAAQEEQPQQTEESAPAEESSTQKEPEQPKAPKAEKDGKIEDFGEKIGGARKDLYRSKIRDSVKLTPKDLKELKDPDKILSRKQIISLMEKSEMTKADAQTLLAMNMAVRSTDDAMGMKTLALMKYRDMASAWEKGEVLAFEIADSDIDFLIDQLSDRVKSLPNIRERQRDSLERLFAKVFMDYKNTYEAIDYPAVNRSLKSAYIRPGSADGRFWVVASPSSYRGYPFGSMLEAVVKMERLYPEIQKSETKNSNQEEGEKDKFGNLTVTKDDNGWYRIKSRSIPGKIYLSKKFYSKKQAEEFMKDNAATLIDREQKMVEALLGSNIGMVNRQGRDYRNGKDVTPVQMLETFGFRGVEFGNWVPQAERQEYLNKTYDAIMDFCDIVGISPKAFSLGGRLGLAFGARGHSRALAHYEPMKEVINLTRMKGAGSLAHEWFHALDNYLAKQKTGNTSDMATSTKDTVREETAKAFRDFVSAMDKLDYSRRSQRAGDYWGEVWERAARLFESYVYNELGSKSVVSPLLVRKDTLFDDSISEENVQSAWPYPSIAENEQMKPFFDNLFQTIEERVQEDGQIALAGTGTTESNVAAGGNVRTYAPTVPEVNHDEYQKRLDEVAAKMNGVAPNSTEYKELVKQQEKILSEYQDAIDPKHIPTSFRTYEQLEDYFLSIGMSETSAKTNADYMRDNEAYGAYMRGRMVFVNEKNTNLEAFRDHYVHERQHHLNERGGIDKKLFDKVGGDLDMLESALSKFVGTSHAATYRFYYQLNNQPEAIADEVIAYAMGLAYYEPAFANDPKFSQLAKEIQDFINDQVNEQFENSYRPAIQGQRYQYLNDRGRRSIGAQTSEGESGGVSDGSRRNDEGIEGDQTPRFGLETDPDVLAKLESGKKVKVYRAMQVIDGKLYPPMSAKVDGKLREPIELGKWEKAEEQPELADDKGDFVLNKGNGSSLKAKYNPYFHTSRSPLNDQFTSAYNRPNLVTVEVEVPESELTSGYKAEKAKDAVGEMTWHSGPVSGKLPEGKKRKVILSRWDKPVRVLSDSEVADRIAELLDGENIAIPYNVVTPGLRAELAQRGVAISDSPSGTVRDNTLRSREGGTVERRVSAAEREVTNATLDRMSEELGIKINRVSRDQMPMGHKSDKGYYNPATGEMTICMDNARDERDAIATVLHETVGHHGLRKLFGDRFRDAMVRIYAALDEKGRTWVNSYIARHPNADNAVAVEEYLAHLAESGNFKNTVWSKIKEIFGKIVDALFGTKGFLLTDNELNYILRASYEYLKNPNWLNTAQGKAFDTLLKRQLGINETDPNKPTDPDGPGAGRLYRDGDTGVANDDYNREMDRQWNKALTENQDADRPVKIGMDKVMKEKGIKSISEDEDYLVRHNIASSRSESEAHEFELSRFNPLLEQVRSIRDRLIGRKATDADRQQAYERVLDYMYAVSGLERNASKNAEIEQAKQAKLADAAAAGITDPAKLAEIAKKYDDMKRDWSGITSLMGMSKDNWQAAESAAQAMIDAFKREIGDDAVLDELWNRVRACTDFSLEHAYQHGLLTREEFERLHGTASQPRMWDYYLPLRGFSEPTAEEQFSYENFTNPSRNSVVVKKMNGRWTQADNPLANILNIAETEIVQGNDNWAKQALYRFALNAGENSLLAASEPWYVKNPATGKWSLAFPDPGESLEEFEARMKALRALDDPLAKKGRRGLKLENIVANKAHRDEHAIHLKVGGIDKMIWVNGDPALAKAVSGIGRAQNLQWIRRASRTLSNLFTTYSLDFTAKNLIRDTIYSRVALLVKEDKAYRHQFRKNWYANLGYGAFAYPMVRLASEWENGTLMQKEKAGTLTKREQDFLNFMRDGGQTGYTIVNSVSQIKKDIERSMRRSGDKPGTVPILGWYANAVKTLNEGFELLTRFTAYQTSRDMGRSGQRAASDAKEISVNFNRRGAQSGNGIWGNIAAYLGATHYFYNAGVQGFDNFLKLYKKAPVKMTAATASLLVMGMLTPFINSMLAGLVGGGDGDDDWYWNLPEWVRRNNIVIGTGKWYLAIPLPVEFRAPYGIGDIAGSAFAYDKYPNRDFGDVVGDIFATASSILPVNPVEGYTSNGNIGDAIIRTVAPDAGMFFVDWATNRDYTGRPLWKENPFSETVPRSQGAYASTPKGIVAACQKIAEVTNGGVDIAPGLVRDAMNNYLGGFFRAAEDVSKEVYGLFGNDPDRPFRWDNVPFFSGFTGHIDEDRSNSFAQNALYDYKKLSEDNVKSMNAMLNTDEVTSAVLYDEPQSLYEREGVTLVQKAKIKRMLDSEDYALGKMYREGMNNTYKMKQSMKDGHWYKSREIEKKGVNTLRQEWKDLRDEWAKMPNKTEEQKSAKAEMELKVQEAWHLYYDAQADLAEKLMDYEYNHTR